MKAGWLSVDWGEKRVGLAVSDPTGTIASPLPALKVRGDNAAVQGVLELLDPLGIKRIVVGLPLSMDGTDSSQTRRVRAFAVKLAKRSGAPVCLLDERLSSRQAERDLSGMGWSREKKKASIDSAAASLILQSALNGAILIPVSDDTKG